MSMIARRRFLTLSLGAAALGPWRWAAGPAGAATEDRRRLVVILLRGAVDGLSVVAPYTDAAYALRRPNIALGRPGSEGGALDLDGRFGLHPALSDLMPLWRSRRLAFVHAAGSPDPTRSHFDAQDYMESGTPGRKATSDGWLNRLSGLVPDPEAAVRGPSPLRAVSVGPVMPRILTGPRPVSSIAQGPAARRATPFDRPAVAAAFDDLYAGDDAIARTFRESREAHREMRASLGDTVDVRMDPAADRGAPASRGFPHDAARLAELMRRDPRVQIAFVSLGGWDTHANQGGAAGALAGRLAPLGRGLAALADGLGAELDRTVVVVMSEFGRTVRENGNRGTDHGHGNVMWLLGGPVRGGRVHGEWPGLDDGALYEGRDLPVVTDFRAVLTQVAERHLGMPDTGLVGLFPGAPAIPASLRTIEG
jgi:uncharacterized protein (DUF1501 family)